jgi:hypothetical protein
MQIPHPSIHAEDIKYKLMYYRPYREKNPLRNEEVLHLLKGRWENLK